MREVLDPLYEWWREGHTVGMATVVATWRSAPHRAGAALVVGPDGQAVGGVSGGCVEAAAYEACRATATDGVPSRHAYTVSDHDALAVGLPCGGSIDLYVAPVDRSSFPDLGTLAGAVRRSQPVALATGLGTDRPPTRALYRPGCSGSPVAALASVLLARADPTATCSQDGVFVTAFPARPRLIVFGSTDFAAALARIGRFLGYRVTVCDPRPAFTTPQRFPDADEVVVDWPHRYLAAQAPHLDARTAVCVLSHDARIDVPALEVALRLPVGFVGALGSRRTNDARLVRLREAGVPEEALARLHAPLGLDLGGAGPEETALSVAAQLVSARYGGSGSPLSTTTGPIHARRFP
jgi:xanthine dehydrogenase accessory factor